MSNTQIHKALVLPKLAGDFAVVDVPTSTPGPGELLVKAYSVALNPADWKIHKGRELDHYPAILGLDMAGEVVQVGEGVKGFAVGDRVLGQTTITANHLAGFQQYIIKDAATTAKIPENLTYDEAGTLPLGVATGLSGLYAELPHGAGLTPPLTPDTEGKYAGKPIVVLGGSSSVGQGAIQFAKLSGFSPIITTASEKHSDFLKSLGATHVLSRQLESAVIVSTAKSIAGQPIDVVYDAISLESTQKLGASLLADGGSLVLVLPTVLESEETQNIKIANTYAAWTTPWNLDLFEKAFHDHFTGWLKDGRIKPNHFEILPNGLKGIPGGLKRMENDQVSAAKLLAHPHETQ